MKFYMFINISLLFLVLLPSLDCTCVSSYICSYSWQMVCNWKLYSQYQKDGKKTNSVNYYVLHLSACHFQMDYAAPSMHNISNKAEESVLGV